jgi:pyruvate,water dikinase
MPNLLWFTEIGITDIAFVGGKNASLGEMTAALTADGIKVPPGFATTASAYRRFLRANRLEQEIADAIMEYRCQQIPLTAAGARIRTLILHGELPDSLRKEVCLAYEQLAELAQMADPPVAVRSSATAEDLAGASFAGQQETFLNVRGESALLEAVRKCFASLFTDRAISYREIKGFDHLSVALSVGVQRMVASDVGASGVMFTIDTETGFPRVVTISAAYGLGESVVQGMVDPDQVTVFKPLLDGAPSPIIGKRKGGKEIKIVCAEGQPGTRTVYCSDAERARFVLDDEEALQLARWAVAIESHYGKPMDIEWAKDGRTGELFILQARPETVQAERVGTGFDAYRLTGSGPELAQGVAIGSEIASGKARIVRSAADLEAFRDGEILVAEITSPDWVPVMKRAAGIVTDHGGSTSHAAIVSRELGIPAVVGTGFGSTVIAEGDEITLSCAAGERGIVYRGLLSFTREHIDVGSLPATRTDLMVNLANPEAAFQWWRLPAKGVGLARTEMIIGSAIKLHPMAAAHPERLDGREAEALRALAADYGSPAEYFIDTLARGVAKLAAAFHPHPAIVRMSDFKSNEYAHLIGGSTFEPSEENPMIGFRGASRYYADRYRDGFALECRAMKYVREQMGFTNVILMIPFCRTPHEADLVLQTMAENGLKRGENGLQIYMMCEIPSNVILADVFAKSFDGFSIGSNDLTQLVLGVDRDSGLLAPLFNERDWAVRKMIEEAIAKAHESAIKIGICGQAPSNYPDFAAFLVAERIDSISLNPDSFVATLKHVAEAEAASGETRRLHAARQMEVLCKAS